MTKSQRNTCIDCVGKPRDYRSAYGHLELDPGSGATVLAPHTLGPADFTVYDYTRQAFVKRQRYVTCGHLDACGCYGKAHAGEPADVHTLANCEQMSGGVHVAADCEERRNPQAR